MADIRLIPPFRASKADAAEALKFRLWRMVCDIRDYVTRGNEEFVVLNLRDESYSLEPILQQYASELDDGEASAEGFVHHFVSRIVPEATQKYFAAAGRLADHDAFLASPEPPLVDRHGDDVSDDLIDELTSDLLVMEQIWFGDLPIDVIDFAVEGWLRMELAKSAEVNDVLCSGYDVRFVAREFAAWFVSDLLSDLLHAHPEGIRGDSC